MVQHVSVGKLFATVRVSGHRGVIYHEARVVQATISAGINTGAPYHQPDPVTRRMDYYGPDVNRAGPPCRSVPWETLRLAVMAQNQTSCPLSTLPSPFLLLLFYFWILVSFPLCSWPAKSLDVCALKLPNYEQGAHMHAGWLPWQTSGKRPPPISVPHNENHQCCLTYCSPSQLSLLAPPDTFSPGLAECSVRVEEGGGIEIENHSPSGPQGWQN